MTDAVPAAPRPLRRSWLPWLPLFLVVALVLLIGTMGDTGPSTNEERVTAIARTVKCPECEGESVADSNSALSRATRIQIAEQVQAGRTDDEIRDFLEATYPGRLLTPTSTGLAGLIWIIPVVVLVFSLAGLAFAFRRWNHERPPDAVTDDDRDLVRAALDDEHRRQRRGRRLGWVVSTVVPEPNGPDEAVTDTASGTAARRARQEARRRGGPGPSSRTVPPKVGVAPPSAPASATRSGEPPVPTARASRRELDPDVLAALEEERSFLLRSLDDLEREHDAGDVDDVDYQGLKDDYTARAAAVIRAIDQRRAASERARRPRARARTVAWVAALLVVSVGLGVVVAQSSGRREAGDSISGDIRMSTRDQFLDARAAFADRRFVDAIAIYDEVLAAQPANTEALTYKAWLLYQTSTQVDVAADQELLIRQAKDLLDQAVTIDEDYADARVFRASVSGTLGDYAGGLADLDALTQGAIPAFMSGRVDTLRSELEAGLAGSGAPGTTVAPVSG